VTRFLFLRFVAQVDLDIDLDLVDLDTPEWSGDINNVASVLKMWLRELPDPLLTYSLHQGFIEAASEHIGRSAIIAC
jgi:hypothetical protein